MTREPGFVVQTVVLPAWRILTAEVLEGGDLRVTLQDDSSKLIRKGTLSAGELAALLRTTSARYS